MNRPTLRSPGGVTPDQFRDVIGRFASGVTVITTVWYGRPFGATASAVSSLSLEPPMLLVCLSRQSGTAAAIAATGSFTVNILDETQDHLARHFASKSAEKFDDVATVRGLRGEPLLEGALAYVECRVTEQVSGGTHTVFLGEVDRATGRPGDPLTYFRGQFGRLRLAHDERAHRELRAAVVDRAVTIGDPLDTAALAAELSVPERSVQQALMRLVDEGLVSHDGDGGFFVVPLTFERVEDAYRARLAAHLGAAVMSVGTLNRSELAELRELAEAARPRRPDGRRLAPEEWFDANSRFLEYMLAAAGSNELVLANRGFSLPGLMTRSVLEDEQIADDLADDHLGIVEAYESGDLAAAFRAIQRVHERAIAHARERMDLAHGRI
jgi:flavin reductase (DIM6/NTAB) family NADH-FMN oxidoreductase RutF/DNA-binding FadR family transcriptional regulator